MSAESNPAQVATESNESIQFDRAEFDQSTAFPCAFCKTPIAGDYFQVNGQTSCPNCREQLNAAISGGSKTVRALRALAAGTAAGIVGFFIYWGVRALTGYEVGLISILVGFMVGGAVRWGAQIRGGLFYQLMAVVLTYLSIASNYTPDIIKEMRKSEAQQDAPAAPANFATTPLDPTAPATIPPVTTAPTSPDAETTSQPLPLLLALPIAFIFSLAVPFLSGLSNIIGLLIIAFGLWQAWSMNKRVPIEVSGPFNTGSAPPQAPLLQT
jgi:hypothetical protein